MMNLTEEMICGIAMDVCGTLELDYQVNQIMQGKMGGSRGRCHDREMGGTEGRSSDENGNSFESGRMISKDEVVGDRQI
eukprot:768431-Hanusia_phi.AAC.5